MMSQGSKMICVHFEIYKARYETKNEELEYCSIKLLYGVAFREWQV